MSVTTNRLQAGGAGQLVRLVKYGGLLLACAVAVLLSTGARAEASNCTDLEECQTAATWEKALADDYSNKSAWFREMSRQNFVSAKEWGDKATWAFHSGDTAAVWYKAIADDYSQKSVANAKAADENGMNALFWAAAADTSFRRYMFIANIEDGIPTAGTGGQQKDGTSTLKKAKAICKGVWAIPCAYVFDKVIDGGVRYVWKLVGGSTCLRQETRYDVNPSTGYVNRVYHVCVKLG
jgi:hypothetical protein